VGGDTFLFLATGQKAYAQRAGDDEAAATGSSCGGKESARLE
jgi:hypothetical protein